MGIAPRARREIRHTMHHERQRAAPMDSGIFLVSGSMGYGYEPGAREGQENAMAAL